MSQSKLVQTPFGQTFKLHTPQDGILPKSAKRKHISDPESARQFMQTLNKSSGFWRCVLSSIGSHLKGHGSHVQLIKELSLQYVRGRFSFIEVEALDPISSPPKKRTIRQRDGVSYRFEPASVLIISHPRELKKFTNIAAAKTFISDLGPTDKVLHDIVESLKLTQSLVSSSANKTSGQDLLALIAEKITTEDVVVVVQRPRMKTLASESLAIPAVVKRSVPLAPPTKEPAAPKERGINEPKNLAEAVERLAVARENLKRNGYVPKYTDAELRKMAKKGEVPRERFVVRFSSAPKVRDTEALIAAEDNEGPIGHERDSGRHPLWMSTFDQLENADTDPEVIADVFGTNYNPDEDYVLYIVDLGEDFEANGSDVFVPTFKNMQKKLKTEFAGDLTPELIDQVMTDEYSVEFREHWKDFNASLKRAGKHWSNSFDVDEARAFAGKNLTGKDAEAFVTRQKILSEIGAWEVFTGNGLTEMKSQPGKAGALETLDIQHSPESVKDLVAKGKVIEIPLSKPTV